MIGESRRFGMCDWGTGAHMSRFDHDRVMNILAEAMELPEPRRVAFLDSTCCGEQALRREIDDLLECAPHAANAFELAGQRILPLDPDRIGPYEIISPIGEGGMAVVYKAQQHEPVRRTVAVKLIKLGMDTRQFVARFESERQALAMMEHPNIAKVHDAGATDTGRPYFAMEYVAGESIIDYCDSHRLTLRRRLELFIEVCGAIEHAHRRGIIHRDIKDSNVLVTEIDGRAVPKVIDFGVAKAISQRLTDRTMFTEQGQLIGTPGCMSPEQIERGERDIDTRTDVYSLGVLLYELIGGVEPVDLDAWTSGGYEQILRIIRETEPPRPSTRLGALSGDAAAAVAQCRAAVLPTLVRELRNELEWIPLKAMRKDREQRYRSAAEMADDIRNYLGGQPLIAGPESARYKLRKFLKRHKLGVAAFAAMLLLLIAGIIATSWQAVRAKRAEARALAERDNSQATLEFLTERVLSGATPEKIPDAKIRDQIVKAMIAPAAQSVGESFKDRPLIEASIRDAIQAVLRDIGQSELALPHAEAALAIRRRELGEDHPDTIQSLHNYGRVLRSLARFADAEPVYREALERRRKVLGEDHEDTLSSMNNYATLLETLGRASEGEPLLKENLERRRRLLGEDHLSTIMSLNNYAHTLRELGRLEEAEGFARETLERWRRVLGEDHPHTNLALSNYADMLTALGRGAEAEPLSRQTLENYRRVFGVDHPDTTTALNNYAAVLDHLHRDAEAEPLYRQALEQRRNALGDGHPKTIWSMSQLAGSLQVLNDRALA
jgi:serine/threonine protein kinase